MKLGIKKAYPVYWIDDTTIRVGAQFNYTKELSDPKQELKVLLPLLNGENELKDVVRNAEELLPHLSEEEIIGGIGCLVDAGLLEDCEQYLEIAERCRVNHAFFSLTSKGVRNNFQQILSNSHIALLGLGGGGSSCLPQLLSLGVGEMSIVDSDIVGITNLNRQNLYRMQDIGEKKVVVAEKYCQEFAPECVVHAFDIQIESVESVKEIINGADCVICAIDQPHFIAQRRVNAASVECGVPCVFMLSQHTCGRMFSVIPHQSGCMDCLHIADSKIDEQFPSQFKAIMHPYKQGSTAAISPHIQRLTSFVVDEVVRVLTHYCEPFAVGKQMDVNYLTGTLTEVMSWSREQGCPTCGLADSQYAYLFDIAPLESRDEYR